MEWGDGVLKAFLFGNNVVCENDIPPAHGLVLYNLSSYHFTCLVLFLSS